MAITRRDLENEVTRLNNKYCKNTKNRLAVYGAYGGYQVGLTGKRRKDGKGWRGIGSGMSNVTYGYKSARDTLADLFKNDSKGYLRSKIRHYEKNW